MNDAQEFEVIVHPLDDGTYWAEVDGLPGCLTQGANYSKILTHLRDAHEACCTALGIEASGGPVSITDPSALGRIITAGDLARFLEASGWQIVVNSPLHSVYRAPGRPECLSVLTDYESPLVPALVAALIGLLKGS